MTSWRSESVGRGHGVSSEPGCVWQLGARIPGWEFHPSTLCLLCLDLFGSAWLLMCSQHHPATPSCPRTPGTQAGVRWGQHCVLSLGSQSPAQSPGATRDRSCMVPRTPIHHLLTSAFLTFIKRSLCCAVFRAGEAGVPFSEWHHDSTSSSSPEETTNTMPNNSVLTLIFGSLGECLCQVSEREGKVLW